MKLPGNLAGGGGLGAAGPRSKASAYVYMCVHAWHKVLCKTVCTCVHGGYAHVCLHAHLHECTCTVGTHVHAHKCLHACLHACACTCGLMGVGVHTYASAQVLGVCTCTYGCGCAHICVHVCAHTPVCSAHKAHVHMHVTNVHAHAFHVCAVCTCACMRVHTLPWGWPPGVSRLVKVTRAFPPGPTSGSSTFRTRSRGTSALCASPPSTVCDVGAQVF